MSITTPNLPPGDSPDWDLTVADYMSQNVILYMSSSR